MLYKQLNRVNELDSEINSLHARLAALYAERSQLIGGKSDIEPLAASSIDTKAAYETIRAKWQIYGVKLPAYQSIAKKLRAAAAIVERLQAENTHLEGKLHIVAVPPQKAIAKLLEESWDLPARFEFTEDVFKPSGSRSWRLLVVTDAEFVLPVQSLQGLIDSEEFRYKDYDCRGLGIDECIAAELQHVPVVSEGNWTLLLKDSDGDDYVPCATRRGDGVVFDIDDADCLLGNNYLHPAIEAA